MAPVPPSGAGTPAGSGPPLSVALSLPSARVAPMKMSQRIGLLTALVLVVFVLTYFLNYIQSPPATDQAAQSGEEADLATLNFPIRSYPYMTVNRWYVSQLELEHRKPGHQDYWFVNENDEKVRMGPISKSCKCQAIEVYVLPEGYKPRFPGPGPVRVAGAGVGPVGLRGLAAAAEDRESTRDLQGQAETVVELKPEDPNGEVTVPPRRAGWVRMKWTGEKAGRMILTAKLWMHHLNSGLTVDLERGAWFVDPARVTEPADRAVGVLKPEDLPRQLSFVVWSSTRNSFNVTKAEPVRPAGLPPSADAFEVGRPIAMTPDDCVRAEAEMPGQGRVRCGYRVPVTLRKLAPDGKTPFELGNFRRRVEVVTDVFDKPLSVAFTGVVQSDVQISGVDDGGGVPFGTFRRDSSPTRTVTIRSDAPGLQMELDRSRVPEYLEAKLTDESAPGGLGKTWKLDLRVKPTAFGPFPRDDDPAYRDSAVYVRSVGPTPQVIRVSVRGDAVDQ